MPVSKIDYFQNNELTTSGRFDVEILMGETKSVVLVNIILNIEVFQNY